MAYRFTFTPAIVRHLQSIERAREQVRLTLLPPVLAEQMRLAARVRSTHYSTAIEGNRLTLAEASQALIEKKRFRGRERDVREVANTFAALEQVERWSDTGESITEERIRRLHGLVYRGQRAKATAYRDGQNVIRDGTGGIVYLPPTAPDVAGLMGELVVWIARHEADLPTPVVAGLAHYQFVTIHPFYDGNGRTARALATWILYRGGYDLGRFYSLEEFYAQDLTGYYAALVTHPHHNYYEGRSEADLTPWLNYFLDGMAVIFGRVAGEVARIPADRAELPAISGLDARGRRVLALFDSRQQIGSAEVAALLSVATRHARGLLTRWVEEGWLEVVDPARRVKQYRLKGA